MQEFQADKSAYGEVRMNCKGTLIVVKDCSRALKFYRDLFGLQLLQGSDGNMELRKKLYNDEK